VKQIGSQARQRFSNACRNLDGTVRKSAEFHMAFHLADKEPSSLCIKPHRINAIHFSKSPPHVRFHKHTPRQSDYYFPVGSTLCGTEHSANRRTSSRVGKPASTLNVQMALINNAADCRSVMQG
jgi:hypothetical protein